MQSKIRTMAVTKISKSNRTKLFLYLVCQDSHEVNWSENEQKGSDLHKFYLNLILSTPSSALGTIGRLRNSICSVFTPFERSLSYVIWL